MQFWPHLSRSFRGNVTWCKIFSMGYSSIVQPPGTIFEFAPFVCLFACDHPLLSLGMLTDRQCATNCVMTTTRNPRLSAIVERGGPRIHTFKCLDGQTDKTKRTEFACPSLTYSQSAHHIIISLANSSPNHDGRRPY